VRGRTVVFRAAVHGLEEASLAAELDKAAPGPEEDCQGKGPALHSDRVVRAVILRAAAQRLASSATSSTFRVREQAESEPAAQDVPAALQLTSCSKALYRSSPLAAPLWAAPLWAGQLWLEGLHRSFRLALAIGRYLAAARLVSATVRLTR